MPKTRPGLICVATVLLNGAATLAFAQTKWINISTPDEVRKVVSGKAIDGKYWIMYFRGDGNMAYYYVASKAMTIRKWVVRKDGQLCSAVFVKPDRVISCSTIERALGNPAKYRLKTRGIGASKFTLVDPPPGFLVKAVDAKAGPSK